MASCATTGHPTATMTTRARTRDWVREALEDILAGREVTTPTTAPAGCSMKWRVELLWWKGCPSHEDAARLLESTLDDLGRGDVHILSREIRSRAEAEDVGFVGSPTFAVGSQDLFPSDAAPALTCRIYQRADGRVSPLPNGDDLASRLRDVLARPWDLPGWVDFREARTS